MIVLGLTGSIGMGKSTAASMFIGLGVPVHDSDAVVHELLSPGGGAVNAVVSAFPNVLDLQSGGVDRKKLGAIIFTDTQKKRVLEGVLHPLVRESQTNFLQKQKNNGAQIVVLDIPLLYETGGEKRVDKVVVVTAPKHIQDQRVMARPNMTRDKYDAILKGQIDDAEKCRRADFVVKTGLGHAHTMRALKSILCRLKNTGNHKNGPHP